MRRRVLGDSHRVATRPAPDGSPNDPAGSTSAPRKRSASATARTNRRGSAPSPAASTTSAASRSGPVAGRCPAGVASSRGVSRRWRGQRAGQGGAERGTAGPRPDALGESRVDQERHARRHVLPGEPAVRIPLGEDPRQRRRVVRVGQRVQGLAEQRQAEMQMPDQVGHLPRVQPLRRQRAGREPVRTDLDQQPEPPEGCSGTARRTTVRRRRPARRSGRTRRG